MSLLTGMGILHKLASENPPNVLILNDLLILKGFRSSVMTLLLTILNQYTEEGLYEIAVPRGGKINLRGLRGSVIACMTSELLGDNRSKWFEMGFLSRCIPFVYNLSHDMVVQINDGIQDNNKDILAPPQQLPKKLQVRNAKLEKSIDISDSMSRQVREISDGIAMRLGEKGIRLQKLFRALVCSHALLHGSSEVEYSDILFLASVCYYISYPPKPEWVKVVGGHGYWKYPPWEIKELGSHIEEVATNET
jgi:hypothetical protein